VVRVGGVDREEDGVEREAAYRLGEDGRVGVPREAEEADELLLARLAERLERAPFAVTFSTSSIVDIAWSCQRSTWSVRRSFSEVSRSFSEPSRPRSCVFVATKTSFRRRGSTCPK
jgi:hypothetical protein